MKGARIIRRKMIKKMIPEDLINFEFDGVRIGSGQSVGVHSIIQIAF